MTLAFKANKNVVVTATGATVGEQARTGNDFTYPITVTANTENITITIASATTSSCSKAKQRNLQVFLGVQLPELLQLVQKRTYSLH